MEYKTDFQIVLDLDSTLIYTYDNFSDLNDLNIYSDPKHIKLRNQIYILKIYDIHDVKTEKIEKMFGIYRPYVLEFLLFCSKYFKYTHIWSAGSFKYVHALINELFTKNNIKKPNNIFTYENCEFEGEKYIYKPLSKIYKLIKYDANSKNTLVLDDRDDTFSKNKKNGILIPEYIPEIENNGDICLLQLISWLIQKETIESKDVKLLKKNNIFKEKINKDEILNIINNYNEKFYL